MAAIFIASQFHHLIYITQYNEEGKWEGVPKNLSNWSIWVRKHKWFKILLLLRKMKNLCQTTGIPRNQVAFLDNVSLDIDVFTDEPVVQWVVQVVQSNFIEGSK